VGRALSDHWPEYVIEAAGLGLFMISACLCGTLLGHPDSPVAKALPDPLARRVLMGAAMGLTALGLIYSPWGQRSGAHFNPATTLTFWRLGKVVTADASLYAIGQSIGAVGGVLIAAVVVRGRLAHPSVNYVVTQPGPAGVAAAFVAECAITFVLMTVVLHVSNTSRLARFTGVCAAILVGTYIVIEAPISGMSMNPARSLASAIPAGSWTALWVYFTAPPLGMLAAAQAYVALCGRAKVFCAKLHHDNEQRCIFRCRYADMTAARPSPDAHADSVLFTPRT
jgi:aquaporin Z